MDAGQEQKRESAKSGELLQESFSVADRKLLVILARVRDIAEPNAFCDLSWAEDICMRKRMISNPCDVLLPFRCLGVPLDAPYEQLEARFLQATRLLQRSQEDSDHTLSISSEDLTKALGCIEKAFLILRLPWVRERFRCILAEQPVLVSAHLDPLIEDSLPPPSEVQRLTESAFASALSRLNTKIHAIVDASRRKSHD